MTRAGITAIVAAGAFALAACNGGGDGAEQTTAPSTSTATTSPETTDASSTTNSPTTSPSTSPPSTATTSTAATTTTTSTPVASDDWRAIVEQLGRKRQELYANPDVSRIGEVCADESQCFRQLDVQLSDLASKGWRVVDANPFMVLEATVERFDGDTIETSRLVTVIAVVERPTEAGRIVDSNGETVADVEAETEVGFNTQNRTILGRFGPPGNPWRIVSQDRIREVPA